jgi:hypothetical protein
LENAVLLFMESGGGGGVAPPVDEIRQPIAPTRDVLVGDIYDHFGGESDVEDDIAVDPFGRGKSITWSGL